MPQTRLMTISTNPSAIRPRRGRTNSWSKGQTVRKVREDQIVDALIEEIAAMEAERDAAGGPRAPEPAAR